MYYFRQLLKELCPLIFGITDREQERRFTEIWDEAQRSARLAREVAKEKKRRDIKIVAEKILLELVRYTDNRKNAVKCAVKIAREFEEATSIQGLDLQ